MPARSMPVLRIGQSKMSVLQKLLPLGVLLSLAGCQTTTPTAVTDTSCLALEPIRYSLKDTPETQRQVRGHNAAWNTLCK